MKKIFILLIMLVLVVGNPQNSVFASDAEYTTRVRKEIQQVKQTNNGQQIVKAVDKYSKQYNVKPELIHAVIYVESKYNHKAKSNCGATGLMQLMPSTYKARGGTGNPYNIDNNISTGTKHLAGMLARYKGNEIYALASYNGGSARVDRAIKNDKPLPKDLSNYVRKVQVHKHIIKQEI